MAKQQFSQVARWAERLLRRDARTSRFRTIAMLAVGGVGAVIYHLGELGSFAPYVIGFALAWLTYTLATQIAEVLSGAGDSDSPYEPPIIIDEPPMARGGHFRLRNGAGGRRARHLKLTVTHHGQPPNTVIDAPVDVYEGDEMVWPINLYGLTLARIDMVVSHSDLADGDPQDTVVAHTVVRGPEFVTEGLGLLFMALDHAKVHSHWPEVVQPDAYS